MNVSVDSVLQAALKGLGLRQQVTANNVANADTPGYKARTVNFEQELRWAMAHAPNSRSLQEEVTPKVTLTSNRVGRMDGNSVDMDQELLLMTETAMRYSAVARAISSRLALYNAVVTDGRG